MKEPIDIGTLVDFIRGIHEGALGTLEDGKPFVSSVGFVYAQNERGDFPSEGPIDLQGGIYMLLSDLARHTRHIKKNPEASLLIIEEKTDLSVHERKRVSLQGNAARVENPEEFEKLKTLYLRAFPHSAVFFTLPDFHFYRLNPREIYWVGGFGKIAALR